MPQAQAPQTPEASAAAAIARNTAPQQKPVTQPAAKPSPVPPPGPLQAQASELAGRTTAFEKHEQERVSARQKALAQIHGSLTEETHEQSPTEAGTDAEEQVSAETESEVADSSTDGAGEAEPDGSGPGESGAGELTREGLRELITKKGLRAFCAATGLDPKLFSVTPAKLDKLRRQTSELESKAAALEAERQEAQAAWQNAEQRLDQGIKMLGPAAAATKHAKAGQWIEWAKAVSRTLPEGMDLSGALQRVAQGNRPMSAAEQAATQRAEAAERVAAEAKAMAEQAMNGGLNPAQRQEQADLGHLKTQLAPHPGAKKVKDFERRVLVTLRESVHPQTKKFTLSLREAADKVFEDARAAAEAFTGKQAAPMASKTVPAKKSAKPTQREPDGRFAVPIVTPRSSGGHLTREEFEQQRDAARQKTLSEIRQARATGARSMRGGR